MTNSNYIYEAASPQLLAAWHHKMKKAMAQANDVDHKIVAHRTALRAYAHEHGYSRNQTIAFISGDLELQQLLDDFKFYSGEIQRFNAMIQAELAMRTLNGELNGHLGN